MEWKIPSGENSCPPSYGLAAIAAKPYVGFSGEIQVKL